MNNDRHWYDRGWSDAIQQQKKDDTVPRVIGVVCLTALLCFDQYWIIGFVMLWAIMSLFDWYDTARWHEPNPPERQLWPFDDE